MQSLKNPHRGAFQQGHSSTVKYSYAERQLKNLAHSKLKHSLKLAQTQGAFHRQGQQLANQISVGNTSVLPHGLVH